MGDKGSGKQGEDLTHDVAEQGNGSQLGPPEIGDEDARERIVSESGTDGQRVGRAPRKQQRRGGGPEQRAESRGERQQGQARIELPDTAGQRGVVAERDADAEHQGIEDPGADSRTGHVERREKPHEASRHKEGHDDEAPLQRGPHRLPGRLSGRSAIALSLGLRGSTAPMTSDVPPQQPRGGDAPGNRQGEDCECRDAERGQPTDHRRVGADLGTQQEQQQPDDRGDRRQNKTEAPAAKQTPGEDASEEDSKDHKHCGQLPEEVSFSI